jgi:hypothetical protein
MNHEVKLNDISFSISEKGNYLDIKFDVDMAPVVRSLNPEEAGLLVLWLQKRIDKNPGLE